LASSGGNVTRQNIVDSERAKLVVSHGSWSFQD
jgi:hypothetical protein